MNFQNHITEIIKIRSSCRTYDLKKINDTVFEKLNSHIEEINQEAKNNERFLIINKKHAEKAEKLGTYGVISGANTYIVGVINSEKYDAVSFGYLFEKIILFATDLGLQTCWLGGTFKREDFIKHSNLKDKEYIPIVSPVGYKKDKSRIVEAAMRKVVGANNRKPWNELFFDGSISETLEQGDANFYATPLEMVRLGPSASNKQPWRVIKDKNSYHFYLCRTKGYGADNYDIQKNDIGIAMCHFELTAKDLGLAGNWNELKDVYKPDDWEYIITWIAK
ncbi:nitroreductase family protein [Sedimentibacter sp.]|uniref:nitroreductase family protein n=1 Tax=Sedimentibacter sp. TaxID=1960295 RepID=UPI0028A9DA44|nr:nitroreductase family protein [Sedimentibacter sp.]